MNWEKPSFVAIDMNAEIGGYQGEDGEGPDRAQGDVERAPESEESRHEPGEA